MSYSHGWGPADEAASVADANARDARRAAEGNADRLAELEKRVDQLEAALLHMRLEAKP